MHHCGDHSRIVGQNRQKCQFNPVEVAMRYSKCCSAQRCIFKRFCTMKICKCLYAKVQQYYASLLLSSHFKIEKKNIQVHIKTFDDKIAFDTAMSNTLIAMEQSKPSRQPTFFFNPLHTTVAQSDTFLSFGCCLIKLCKTTPLIP